MKERLKLGVIETSDKSPNHGCGIKSEIKSETDGTRPNAALLRRIRIPPEIPDAITPYKRERKYGPYLPSYDPRNRVSGR